MEAPRSRKTEMTFPKISELRNIVPNWDPENYFADEAINFHSLRDYKRNPKRFAAGEYDTRETTDAMRMGTQFHQLVREGDDVFGANNALWTPPINEKTGKQYGQETKAYAAALEAWKTDNAGKTPYSEEEYQTFLAMKEAIISNQRAGEFLFPAGDVSEYASELRFKGEYIPGWFAKGKYNDCKEVFIPKRPKIVGMWCLENRKRQFMISFIRSFP